MSNPVIQAAHYVPERQHSFIIWVTLIGVFFPPILVPLGGVNFTLGRLVVIILLIPACGLLFTRGRNRVASDLFALLFATWMLVASALSGGFRPYVGAEALEFLGAYLAGRAFFFGPSNFQMFIRALKPITALLVALAVVDTLAGRNITLDSFGIPNFSVVRLGLVRAASVFEGAEHYGTFCVAATAIFLYSERGVSRLFYVGLSIFGCALSLSSGPLLGLVIVMAAFSYDRILKQYPWRWKALTTAIAAFIILISLISDRPIEWMLVHFTIDPQTGFFRIETWNSALPLIGQSPFVGHGIVQLGDSANEQVFLRSVDSLWLVEALRYGVPAVILLVMTIFSPLLRGPSSLAMDSVQTGVSLAVVSIAAVGLTVHFWDATWLFLSLCIGIRASLTEYGARRQAFLVRSRDLLSMDLSSAVQHPAVLRHTQWSGRWPA
jgi:hypothetical protein